ncbi:MAG: T9SS type A sorting domain-containing protein [Bacteroidota bacterium]
MKKALLSLCLLISGLVYSQANTPGLNFKSSIGQRENSIFRKRGTHNELNSETNTNQKFAQVNLIANVDSSYQWIWDTANNAWAIHPYSRIVGYTYNSNGDILSALRENWNGSSWDIYAQYFYAYDANNNMLTNEGQNWNGSAWVSNYKYSYTYDVNNNITNFLYQIGNPLVNQEQDVYTYDANNNEISHMFQTWNGSSWDNIDRQLSAYDSNNNLIMFMHQDWLSSSWTSLFREIHTYDVNNNQIYTLNQNWIASSWDSAYVITRTYDSYNNCIGALEQVWNGINWEDWQKKTYVYNVNNKIVSTLYQRWIGNVWENDYQEITSYGISIASTILYQIWDGTSWINGSQHRKSYDQNGFLESFAYKVWNPEVEVMYGDSIHHYFHTVTGINEIQSKQDLISIFPNPTSSSLSIKINLDYNSIKIVNSVGETVFVAENTSQPISVSQLSTGIYFIQVIDKKGVVLKTEKFIKN